MILNIFLKNISNVSSLDMPHKNVEKKKSPVAMLLLLQRRKLSSLYIVCETDQLRSSQKIIYHMFNSYISAKISCAQKKKKVQGKVRITGSAKRLNPITRKGAVPKFI